MKSSKKLLAQLQNWIEAIEIQKSNLSNSTHSEETKKDLEIYLSGKIDGMNQLREAILNQAK